MSSRAGYQRARTKRLRDCGLCFVCGQRPAWKPDKACVECRDKARAKYKENRRDNASKNEDLRQYRATLTAREAEFKRTHPPRRCGRCARQFQPSAARRITCESCFRNDAEVNASLRDRWAS